VIFRIQFVIEEHSRPLEASNCANIAIIYVQREAVGWNQVVEGVKKVCLIIVVLALCQIVISIVVRVPEELKIFHLARL
jgi:hypothetical protein